MYRNKICTCSAASAFLWLQGFGLVTESVEFRTLRGEPHQNIVVRKINT